MIRGGYEGDPQDPESWNPVLFETILSGDTSGDDTGSSSTWTDNAHHVLEAAHFDDAGDLRLEGLTIERGTAALASVQTRFGGGLLVRDQPVAVDVFVERCIFRHNRAMAGGGAIACWTNTFQEPPPTSNQEPALGSHESPLHVRECVFEFNELISPPDCGLCVNLPEFGGGAIFSDADLRVSLSAFRSNGSHASVSPMGGAIFLWPPADLLRVVNSSFIDNEVVTASIAPARGRAICAYSAEDEIHMTVDVTGCLLARNRAIGENGSGGGIDMANLGGLLLVRGSTLVGNEAMDIAGGVITFSDATVTNSILYRNTAEGTTLEQQLSAPESEVAEITTQSSCVEGLTLEENDTNINGDPAFVDEENGVYRLRCSSPARNAGSNALIADDDEDIDDDAGTTKLPWDLDGRQRIELEVVDMGAYEHALACEGDFDGDGEVDGDDLGTLLGDWGECPDCLTDLNCSGDVDGDDLGTLLGAWGCCPGVECVADQMPESFAAGPITPQGVAEEFGFETVEAFAEWLSSLDFETMSALLEGLFGG